MWYCNMFTMMKNLPFPLIGTTSTENLLYILQLLSDSPAAMGILSKNIRWQHKSWIERWTSFIKVSGFSAMNTMPSHMTLKQRPPSQSFYRLLYLPGDRDRLRSFSPSAGTTTYLLGNPKYPAKGSRYLSCGSRLSK